MQSPGLQVLADTLAVSMDFVQQVYTWRRRSKAEEAAPAVTVVVAADSRSCRSGSSAAEQARDLVEVGIEMAIALILRAD